MGILVSTMRLMTLFSLKGRIEFQMMEKTSQMSDLTQKICEQDEYLGDLDSNSPEAKTLEAEKRRLNALEGKLKREQQMLQTRYQEVTQEIQACQQMLTANIQSGFFTYGMPGGH